MSRKTIVPQNSVPKQLDLFSSNDNQSIKNDPRPLPLIIAGLWEFPLQHYETESGYLYSVQDWISGVAQTTNYRQYWQQMKKQTDVNSVFTSQKLPRGK